MQYEVKYWCMAQNDVTRDLTQAISVYALATLRVTQQVRYLKGKGPAVTCINRLVTSRGFDVSSSRDERSKACIHLLFVCTILNFVLKPTSDWHQRGHSVERRFARREPGVLG